MLLNYYKKLFNLPLQIDSSNPDAIEEACRYYNGKPLINSVNGKDETMEAVFPVVKKYGGVVIGLALDENGIPPKADKDLKSLKKSLIKQKNMALIKKTLLLTVLF